MATVYSPQELIIRYGAIRGLLTSAKGLASGADQTAIAATETSMIGIVNYMKAIANKTALDRNAGVSEVEIEASLDPLYGELGTLLTAVYNAVDALTPPYAEDIKSALLQVVAPIHQIVLEPGRPAWIPAWSFDVDNGASNSRVDISDRRPSGSSYYSLFQVLDVGDVILIEITGTDAQTIIRAVETVETDPNTGMTYNGTSAGADRDLGPLETTDMRITLVER